ncbi:amino acid adenylation domain-containing protein [Paenibacillus algorifonticola]|uniref:Amino acid adenylation domain-containing protein n=1 Tax=Paenibacillus algorifonticola TaxID=684063 RepID=A0A1I1YTP9_9BACL|nr:non-ribosomal peptide synthetase [Paenibacillus algorifonticola]SFE22916.1 amino acid adenylation domain-containing protein [Paenibacillus algorifonticola]
MDSYSENMLLTGGKWQEEREYWLGKLDPSAEPTAFEGDLKDAGLRQGAVDLIKGPIPPALTERLLSVCRNSQQGLYAFLLSGALYMLHRYTGERIVTAGMPSGQQTAANIAPNRLTGLQVPVDEALSFKEYLQCVSQTVQEARKYKHIPFQAIIRLLKQDSEAVVHAFKTVVALNTLHAPVYMQDSKATVTFYFIMEGNRLQLELLYERSMYSQRYMERLFNHFVGFLDEVLQNTAIPLNRIHMLSQEEMDELERFNLAAVPYPKDKTVHELFDSQAMNTADWTALRFGGIELTYGELKDRSDRLACLLRSKGIERHRVAAVMTNRSLEMMIAILAVLKAGGAYLPIDPAYPQDRIKHMLVDSGAGVLLTQDGLISHVDFQGETVNLDDNRVYGEFDPLLSNVNDPEDAAYLIYTSGSTGLPKGVLVPHRAVVNFITGITSRIPAFTGGKTIAAVTTLCFDIFVLETLLPLTQGLVVVIAGEEEQHNPALLKRWLTHNRIELLQATPSRIQLLLNDSQAEAGMEQITTLMVGGEAFPDELLYQLRERCGGASIYNMYGPTETTVWSSVKDVTSASSITLGAPITNTQMYIVDPFLRLLPEGVAGELCIAGDGVAIGYWKREDLTADRFVPCPYGSGGKMYRTGDLARRLPGGDIEFLGRIDHQVKIRGFRVELGEVESALLSMEQIKAAVCIAQEDGQGNHMLCAYYVSSAALLADVIRSAVASRLPDYMLPSFYIPLSELPYTPNGKIDRKQLPSPYERVSGLFIGEPPADEQEEKLLRIWKDLLEVEEIGVTDDFFNAGGHSLKALKLEVELEKAGFSFESEDIYRYPTIRGFLRRTNGEAAAPFSQRSQAAAGSEAFASPALMTLKHDDRIKPFNDLFYKECFYHSLFPIVSYYQQSLLPILANDTVIYRYDEDTVHFQVDYAAAKPLEQLLHGIGIRMETREVGHSVIAELKQAVLSNKPVIVRIDCYYASNRTETFKKRHWPHSWLVFGFDDSRQMFGVIEHDHIERLTYQKRWVSYEDTLQGHLGYMDHFGSEVPVYYEFSAITADGAVPGSDSLIETPASAAAHRQQLLDSSLHALSSFLEKVKHALRDGYLIKDYGESLLDTLNQIVNAKLVDQYRYEQLAGVYRQLQSTVEDSLEVWKQIRAQVAKSVFTAKLSAQSAVILNKQLDSALALEREYAAKLVGMHPQTFELEGSQSTY